MPSFLNLLRNLLIRTPLEFFVALLRFFFLLIIFPIVVILRIKELFLELLKKNNLFEKKDEEPCPPLPETVIRRPDPCIYSQGLLASQGLPVTWNNPDIWVARADSPGTVEPDSYHLEDDTDYIVSVQVHNASTDLAIGVRVRLTYRPWSFASQEITPVETDINGKEVFRFVDVMPTPSSTVTQFNWHTPRVEPGEESRHFCLQARLYHPMDINTGNNLGQENTVVYRDNPGDVEPGEEVTLTVPLFNRARAERRFQFETTAYEIQTEDRVTLELKTARGYARWPQSKRLANMLPTLHMRRPEHSEVASRGFSLGRFDLQRQPRLRVVKTRYVGFEALRNTIISRDYSLPPGMTVTPGVTDDVLGFTHAPQEGRDIEFRIRIPDDAQPGARLPLNIIARAGDGALVGGITVILNVKES